jgi:hypothetical protein
VFDRSAVSSKFVEISFTKLVPSLRIMAKPGPEAGARSDIL